MPCRGLPLEHGASLTEGRSCSLCPFSSTHPLSFPKGRSLAYISRREQAGQADSCPGTGSRGGSALPGEKGCLGHSTPSAALRHCCMGCSLCSCPAQSPRGREDSGNGMSCTLMSERLAGAKTLDATFAFLWSSTAWYHNILSRYCLWLPAQHWEIKLLTQAANAKLLFFVKSHLP